MATYRLAPVFLRKGDLMGNWNSGRRPNPAALHTLRGNPSRRPINTREPRPEPLTPDFDSPPAELTGDDAATKEWIRIAPILRKAGHVTQADVPLVIAACQQWSRYLLMNTRTRRGGKSLVPVVKPAVDRALMNCLLLWRELGLTPHSRRGLQTAPPAAETTEAEAKWSGLI